MANKTFDLRKFPGWATKLIDAWQIWNAQFGGWLSPLIKAVVAAVLYFWTVFWQSWHPLAIVAAAGSYVILGAVFKKLLLASNSTKASAIEEGATTPGSTSSKMQPTSKMLPLLDHHERLLQKLVNRIDLLESYINGELKEENSLARSDVGGLMSNLASFRAQEKKFKSALSKFLYLYFRGEAIMDGLKRDKQRWESDQKHWEEQAISFNTDYLGGNHVIFTDNIGSALHWFYADHNRMYERPEAERNINYTEDRFVMHTYQLRTLVSQFQQYIEGIDKASEI